MLMVVVMSAHRAGLLGGQFFQLLCQGVLALDGGQNLPTCQLIPRRGDNRRRGIMLPQKRHTGLQLILGHTIGTAEHDTAGMVDLVIIELTEILHVNTAFTSICDGCEAVQLYSFVFHLLHRTDDIAELAHTRRLDKNTVGVQFIQHLLQSLGEIAHQAAADASGIHLRNLDTGFLHKGAVNTDFAKLVLDQHQLFAAVCLFNQFLYQGGFTGTQEAGEYINFRHAGSLFSVKYFGISR